MQFSTMITELSTIKPKSIAPRLIRLAVTPVKPITLVANITSCPLGKTVRLSVDEGFRHAMSAIVDSNVTTAITGLFLYQFGTGPVQGFAVTLILGIAASMITAIFVTRTFFLLWLERKPAMQTLSI